MLIGRAFVRVSSFGLFASAHNDQSVVLRDNGPDKIKRNFYFVHSAISPFHFLSVGHIIPSVAILFKEVLYNLGVKPDQKIAFILTLLTGMLSGAALYLLVFAPQYSQTDVAEKAQYAISGEVYGGCARSETGCPSFHLSEDRRFQYALGQENTSGTLPKDIYTPIWENVTAEQLTVMSEPTERTDCRSFVDGLDYRYDVTFAGKRYQLDTCTTAFAHADRFHQDLIPAWEFMYAPTTTYPTIIEKGISGWLIERFQSN